MEGPLEKIKRYKEKNVANLCKLQMSYGNNVLRNVDSQGFAVGLTLKIDSQLSHLYNKNNTYLTY